MEPLGVITNERPDSTSRLHTHTHTQADIHGHKPRTQNCTHFLNNIHRHNTYIHTRYLVLSSNKDKTSLAGALITPLHITHAYWEEGPTPRNLRYTEYPSSVFISFQSVVRVCE
jgi:hypothetical protein